MTSFMNNMLTYEYFSVLRYLSSGRSQAAVREMNNILKYHSVTKYENDNYLNVYRDVDLQNKVVNSELGADKKLFFKHNKKVT